VRVALLIDLPPDARYHVATVAALNHAADARGEQLDLRVQTTDTAVDVDQLDGVVIGPGSPYRDEHAVWSVVRSAREKGLPLVGT
jgi:CTP synthase (UTP-ammonia lyase)